MTEEFRLLAEAQEKLRQGEFTLSFAERRVVDRYGFEPVRPCTTEGCSNILEKRVQGRHFAIDGVEMCEACHFEATGTPKPNILVLPDQIRRGP